MKMKKLLFMMTLILGVSLVPEMKADAGVYNGWEKSNGYWYYYVNGSMQTGWQKDGGTWYYMSSNGSMKTGWVKDGGKWYYLSDSGAMATGWVKDGEKWYYLSSSGDMVTGWLKDGSTWYGDIWYYLDSSGAMKTGWINDSGAWYYLNNDGVMETGWFEDSGTKYYLYNDGKMATGYGEEWAYGYYFNEDGTLASDVTVDGYYVDSDGRWNSSYLGEVKVKAKKSSYYINETKSIDFTITNYTREKVQYKLDYTIKKEVDFALTKDVALKDTSVSDTVYELNPGERKEFSIPLSNIDEKLTADTYELKMKIGDKYEYAYFDLSNDNIIVLKTENNGAVKEGAKKLQFTITNNSDKELTYGKDYKIEKFVYPAWVEVPLKDDSFTEEATVVKPHETNTETIELDNLSEFNEYDEYRIVKEIDGNKYYDIFLDERAMNHVVEN